MNLSKLFELQRELDAPYADVPDRMDKDILWLMTEIGEIANNWNGFKYRRDEKGQKPLTEAEIGSCTRCFGLGFLGDEKLVCPDCAGVGEKMINPLLEEYTDCLSIVLSLGLEDDIYERCEPFLPGKDPDITTVFLRLHEQVVLLYNDFDVHEYQALLEKFFVLGNSLGFTHEQILYNYLQKFVANKKRNEVSV